MISVTKDEIMNYDERYRGYFVNSLSGIKSANLVGTKSKNQETNLTLVSSAFHVGASPPLIGVLFRQDTVPRHGLENIRETSEFTLNHIHHSFIQKAHQSTARYERDESEFKAVGLTEEYLDGFNVPFVKESHIKLQCRLAEEHKLVNGTHLIVATIELVTMKDEFRIENGGVDIVSAGSVGASSLDHYHELEKGVQYPYAKKHSSF